MIKSRGTDGQIIGLIHLKRQRAWEAMNQIITASSGNDWKSPSWSLILEYLSNMVPCLELMAKLLSGDWNTHKIGNMYTTVFPERILSSDFQAHLETALRDQKYFFKPITSPANTDIPSWEEEVTNALATNMKQDTDKNLAHFIPEMEHLFDEFKTELLKQHDVGSVVVNIALPNTFAEYIQANVARFYVMDGILTDMPFPKSKAEYDSQNAKHLAEFNRQVDVIKARIRTYLQDNPTISILVGNHFHNKYLM